MTIYDRNICHINEHDINTILSKARYWHEIIQREDKIRYVMVAHQELQYEVERLGIFTVLFMLEDYAKKLKEAYK